MSIDRKTVDHVALLARLALTDDERQKLQDQLGAILEHINVIGEADTGQVPATAHILPLTNIMREDQPQDCEQPEELVDRAPSHERTYIRVRAVLDNE
jgi:aspartyl-tRNA(Asn)/glutamyl-tRNA(Gln) amidotransferase subunit C